MMLKIGEKIKELREKNNFTQSKMAAYLGITEQAISRWENGGGYPDMELIPAIANFLNASTDELFETDRKAERLINLKREAGKNTGWDHKTNCEHIEAYRSILKEFPNDYETMFLLTVYLGEENHIPQGQHSDEIISLSNRIIADSPDFNLRRIATGTLASAYKNAGDQETALKIVKESPILYDLQNNIFYSRESVLTTVADGDERQLNRKLMLEGFCLELCRHIRDYSNDDYHYYSLRNAETLSRNIMLREKINTIMEAFYEDGDYGFGHEHMLYNYHELAEYYKLSGNNDAALDNIEKCAETAIKFDTDEEGKYTSLLVRGFDKMGDYQLENYENHPDNIRYNQCYRLINFWFKREELCDEICDTERFKAVIAKLQGYAKVE